MKTSFKRELKAKAILDALSIENYIPMTQRHIVIHGKRRLVTLPAIHNLIFIKVNREELERVKSTIGFIHNYLTRVDDTLRPIVIPDCEMTQFIGITTEQYNQLIYLDLSNAHLSKGVRVRITGGDFEGYQGVLMKVKGARDRRVVLSIEGVMAVAMASIDAAYIERL